MDEGREHGSVVVSRNILGSDVTIERVFIAHDRDDVGLIMATPDEKEAWCFRGSRVEH